MKNAFDLEGRVALITGGNGGLGLAIARGIGLAGATVVIVGRDTGKASRALEELRSHGIRCGSIIGDVTKEKDCAEFAKRTSEEFGSVDILVNNAGIAIRKPPQDYSLEEWERVLTTNLTSAFLCSRAVQPYMARQGHGKIINIASVLAVLGTPFAVAYGASKGGLVQFSRALAVAWAEHNIQVNVVLPGWFDTELTVAAKREVANLNEHVLARTPAKRWGHPEELAGTIVFLSSRAADFITGATLAVDGGFTAQA